MATYTTNLNLKKPDYEDLADIADINANMDTLDAAVASKLGASDVVNNLTETVTGKALDATQGKALSEQISTKPSMTTADITYYVATTGSDSNDGLTVGTPFLTIQHAINSLPQVVNHSVTINVSAGTYNEGVSINGFTGYGIIALKGDTVISTNYSVDRFYISNNLITVNLIGFNITTTANHGITVVDCISCSTTYCNIIGNALSNYGIMGSTALRLNVANCVISNRARGIASHEGSMILSTSNTGSGNTIGLYVSTGSKIAKGNSTQPSGTTVETVATGGQILSGKVYSTDNITISTSAPSSALAEGAIHMVY